MTPILTPARQRTLLALAGALVVMNLASFGFGEAPLETLGRIWAGTWGTPYGIGQVLFKAIPLLFTGVAFGVALRAGLFNIGSEGQLAMASLAAGFFASKLGAGLPWVVALPLVVAVAALVGGAFAAIAGAMRAKLGVHEIITSIMLNRSADVFLPWALAVGLSVDGVRTAPVAEGARVPPLERWFPSFTGSAASLAFPTAVIVAFAVHAWTRRSRIGRELEWVGQAATVCEAQGIDVARRRMQAMVLSGAIGGLTMMGTVLGYKGYYELGLGAGAGFSGIAVAMLGRGGPVQLTLAALLFGTLAQAGIAINARVPRDAMGVIEAVVILLMGAAAFASSQDEVKSPVPANRKETAG
ncbi:MAG: ABC transporter permease [Deltaproteobacteria bacterium]|nr:ABC transporter permease [Deltaproteobacteria bacterium]